MKRRHIWIKFAPDDPVGKKFNAIMDFLGVQSCAEGIRHIITAYDLEKMQGGGNVE